MKRLHPLLLTLAIALGICASAPTHADLVLRQSTASQALMVGPAIDAAGAPLTGLTIDAADVRLSKNGANMVGKNSGGCTHDEIGYYTCTFDATDTDTVGRLQIMVQESGALPIYHEIQVTEEDIYDACCASGAVAPATDGSDFVAIPWNSAWDPEVQSEAADAINADTGDSFVAVPWNAAWDPEVQSEAADAINADTGDSFTSVPWNAAWDAQVQSEAADALNETVLTEPSAHPTWGVSSVADFLAYQVAWIVNKIQQTESTKTLRNAADDMDIASCAVDDDDTTLTVEACN
jgi:hypothetical protein